MKKRKTSYIVRHDSNDLNVWLIQIWKTKEQQWLCAACTIPSVAGVKEEEAWKSTAENTRSIFFGKHCQPRLMSDDILV